MFTPQEMQMQTHHQNQKTSKPHRIQFRTSCDSCAASKVRCTKEQHGCSRCLRNGLKCVYGRSRRKGKPPSKKAALPNPGVHPASSRVPVSPSPPAPPVPVSESWAPGPNHHQPNYNYSCSWYRASNPTEWERRTGNILTPSLTPTLTPDAGIPHLPTPEFGWPNMIGSDSMVTDGENPASFAESGEMNKDHESGYERDEMRNDPDDHHEPCIAVACRTLSSLYQFVQSDCVNRHAINDNQFRDMLKPPTPEESPANDIVFCTTRSATETVSRVLNCTGKSCAQDHSLLLVIGSILLKILTWYEALYQSEIGELVPSSTPLPDSREDVSSRPHHSNTSHSGDKHPAGLSSPRGRMENPIYTVPLTIPLTTGAFSFSRATEKKMKAQLLLCEVQTLSQMFQALDRRVQAAGSIRGEKDLCGQSNTRLQRQLGELQRVLTVVCTQVPSLGSNVHA